MPQWFDPMIETHEGRLLAQVLALEKQLKGEEKLDESKADRNKDGNISGWERKVGEAIEANMRGKGKNDKNKSDCKAEMGGDCKKGQCPPSCFKPMKKSYESKKKLDELKDVFNGDDKPF